MTDKSHDPNQMTGAAMIVKAVIGDEGKGHLPEIAAAEAAVPKLTYISGGRSIEYKSGTKSGRDGARLETARVEYKIANDLVKFTGKGDKDDVLKLLRNFNKVIMETINHAEVAQMIKELKLDSEEGAQLTEKQKQAEAHKVARAAKERKLVKRTREVKELRQNQGIMGKLSKGKKVAPVDPTKPPATNL